MEANLYLIRHGQTTGNGKHYVGWEDLPLNKTGLQQAQNIADLLGDQPIANIYCSVLKRAMATASPLARHRDITVVTTSLLNEINYGAYQGKLKTELELKLRKNYLYRRLPEGESLHDVYVRVKYFFDSITREISQQQNLVIIGHYWSIRMLLGIVQDKNFDDIFSPGGYKPANGSIYKLTYSFDKTGTINCMSEGYLRNYPPLAESLDITEASP